MIDPVLREAHEAIERRCQQVALLPVRSLVIDSDVLLHNLMWDANPVRPPSKLLIQGGIGSVRPYVAQHQLDEVRRHIPEVAARTGIDERRARQIFEQRYLPILWTIDGSMLSGADVGAAMSVTDPDDRPIARLAVLLGVRVVTKNKRHFGELAIEDDWLTVVGAYASVSLMDGTNASIAVSARVSGDGARAASRAIRGGFGYLADHPRLAIATLIIFLVLVGVGAWYLSDDDRRLKAWETLKRVVPPVARFAGRALQGYLELAGIAVEAEVVILASKLPREDLTLEQRLAEYLGGQRYPVRLTTIVEGTSVKARRLITATLRNNPAFVEQVDGWSLGQRCAGRTA